MAVSKKVWIIGGAVVGVLVIGGIGSAIGAGTSGVPEAAQTTPVETLPEPTAPAPTEAPTNDLAERTTQELYAAFGGITTFTDLASTESPLYAVASIENMYPGTVRVIYQNPLDDEGRDQVALHIFNLAGQAVTDLNTVVIRDTSGIDSNHYRSDIPLLNG